MIKIATIIPYYQREPGILRRALASIYAQSLGPDRQVEVIVVDDASPSPPDLDLIDSPPPQFSLRVIRRENGGPGAARNTGLDAVGADTDFIAFLDSDDEWKPGHLDEALIALRSGAEFYFCDNAYDQNQTWFAGLGGSNPLAAEPDLPSRAPYRHFSSRSLFPLMVRECIAHTSSVVFDFHKFGNIRFDEDLRLGGEDYLFWLTLSSMATNIAASSSVNVVRGQGFNLYREALDWNHPRCAARLASNLRFHQRVAQNFTLSERDIDFIKYRISLLQRGITYLMLRNWRRHASSNWQLLKELAMEDTSFRNNFAGNLIRVISQRLRGHLEFPIG